MMSNPRLVSVVLSAAVTLMAAGNVQAGTVEVKDSHLKYGSLRYFRAGADLVTLGAYGEKKTPVLHANYLEVQSTIPSPKLEGKITAASIATIDFTKTTRTSFAGAFSAAKIVNAGGQATFERMRAGHLKLVHLIVTPVNMTKAVNSASEALRRLASDGNDARIAHEIFVVMEATTASAFTAGTSFKVSANAGGGVKVTATAGGTSAKSTTVTLSPGTTFAYLLAKPDWDSGKKRVTKLNPDQWSM
jgi:hypothetical protein